MIQIVCLVCIIRNTRSRITWGLPGLCFPGLEGLRSDPPARFTFAKSVADMMWKFVFLWNMKTCAMRSLMLCSRSSILVPISSILEMIWSDMVWNLGEAKVNLMRRNKTLQPTCLASVGACSGCSWWALPRSWGLVEPPLLGSPHPCHPFPLPRC